MTPERWAQVKELFHAVLEREPAERRRFLEQHCPGDPHLIDEVLGLVAQDRDDSFLERPSDELAANVVADGATSARPSGTSFVAGPALGLRSCPVCSNCYGDGRSTCPHDGGVLVEELPGPALIDSRYRIEQRIGHGGMGVVYRVEQTNTSRRLALKLIRRGGPLDLERYSRFRLEAQVLGRLKHDGIVDVIDSGLDPRDGGLPYLVMEHLEGESLDGRLSRSGSLEPEEAIGILAQIADALDFVHRHGILHRDLKPRNIFLCKSPRERNVKILDFGLARLQGVEMAPAEARAPHTQPDGPSVLLAEAESTSVDAATITLQRSRGLDTISAQGRITIPGRLGGTIGYMAPEVLGGKDATTAADIYAFGIMAYELLTGRRPFDGNRREIIEGHRALPPPRPSSLNPALPPELDTPLLEALGKAPSDRPRRAADLVASLRQAWYRARTRAWRKRELPRRIALAAAIATATAVSLPALSRTGVVQRLETASLDARFALQAPRAPDPRLLLVVLDDASLAADETPLTQQGEEFGRRLAAVLDVGARAVALDILAPKQWGQASALSDVVLRRADRVTLAAAAGSGGEVVGTEAIAGLTAAALGPERSAEVFGLVNVEPEPDGIVRRGRTRFRDRSGASHPSWAARAATTLAGPAVLDGRAQTFWIDQALEWRRIPRIPWSELPRRLESEPEQFRDRLVLVGAEIAGSGDQAHRIRQGSTAVSVSGLVLQALTVNTILSGARHREIPPEPSIVALWLALVPFVAAVLCLPKRWPAFATVAVAVACYLAVALAVFRAGIVMPMALPLAALAAALTAAVLRALLPAYPRAEGA